MKRNEEPTFDKICEEMQIEPWVIASINENGISLNEPFQRLSNKIDKKNQELGVDAFSQYINFVPSNDKSPEEVAIENDEVDFVCKFLEPSSTVLNEDEKEVIRKVLLEGKNQNEIAKELNVRRQHVNMHYFEAIEKIQNHIKLGRLREIYYESNFKCK